MGSWITRGLLAAALALAAKPHRAEPPRRASRLASCPECPPGALFIDCDQGAARMTLVLAPDQPSGFQMRGWSALWGAKANREGPGKIRLELDLPGPGGKRRARIANLNRAGSLTLVPGRDVDAAAVGGGRAPVRCTWAE